MVLGVTTSGFIESRNKLPTMRIAITKKSVGGLSPRSQLRAKIVQKNEASA
jgi:hypothetical protein